uniref:tRNA dimethylallyltransferase,mitochondrial n=1 Tax=Neospora caninum (strain Liverpool) TaxID=572307 RepID=A0A0F7UIX4_NEOCL|nr:TPA: tRNA dimethylallyltransferase,mitochondrial [Neospora caninum Liverpool]
MPSAESACTFFFSASGCPGFPSTPSSSPSTFPVSSFSSSPSSFGSLSVPLPSSSSPSSPSLPSSSSPSSPSLPSSSSPSSPSLPSSSSPSSPSLPSSSSPSSPSLPSSSSPSSPSLPSSSSPSSPSLPSSSSSSSPSLPSSSSSSSVAPSAPPASSPSSFSVPLSSLSSVSAAPSSASLNPRGVVFILGPTGVGKTRLSVEIALAMQRQGQAAEIISADSMQVYRGCDIATAKASVEERKLVPHHLLDICDVDAHFSVLRFLHLATGTIDALHARGVLPIVVGGTQLYLQHLLWRSLLDRYPPEDSDSEKQDQTGRSGSSLERFSTETLYVELKNLDPERAAQLHPRDRRRIIRSIETTQSTGVPHSELMRREREASIQEGLRYPSCILWLDCRDEDIHRRRLDKRVDQMLQAGLLRECEWLLDALGLPDERGQSSANCRGGDAENPDPDSERVEGRQETGRELERQKVQDQQGLSLCGKALLRHSDAGEGTARVETEGDTPGEAAAPDAGEEKRLPGVLQSIGYKEFIPFLLHQRHARLQQPPVSSSTLSDGSCRFGCPNGTMCPPTVASAAACVVTRSCQYAKKQRRWIVNKFLLRQQHLPLYLLDTSHGENARSWSSDVYDPALRIVQDFLKGVPFKEDHPQAAAAHLSEKEKAKRERLKVLSAHGPGVSSAVGKDPWLDGGLNRPRTCTLCSRTCFGESDWHDHLKSKAHRARTKRESAARKSFEVDTAPKTKATETA